MALIYPPRCIGCSTMVESDFGLCGPCFRETPFIGGTVCEACGVPLPGVADGHRIECDDCMAHPRPWSQGRAALVYKDRARNLVLALKHGDRPEIAHPAALWMARAARPMLTRDMVIVPVPLHWTRLLRRRYNQSAVLAHALARNTRLEMCPDLLIRRNRTGSQDGKTAAERFANLKGTIGVHPNRRKRCAGKDILLVDDVMTSGATFATCAEACRAAGARNVFTLALARVAKDD